MLAQQKCVFTVHWIVKYGQVEAALDIIARSRHHRPLCAGGSEAAGAGVTDHSQSADNPPEVHVL
jgi:hypothetical protein